jgi:hypothetical protein
MIKVLELERNQEAPASPQPLYIGAVTGGEEVLWIGAALTRAELAHELAAHLLPRCICQLGEAGARQFRRLLDQGQQERAVDLYFATMDDHWEVERLSVVTRDLVASTMVAKP